MHLCTNLHFRTVYTRAHIYTRIHKQRIHFEIENTKSFISRGRYVPSNELKSCESLNFRICNGLVSLANNVSMFLNTLNTFKAFS